jgi:integrase
MKKAVFFNIQNSLNKGNFLSAKIYADENKSNQCRCGGKFNEYYEFDESILIPRCASCSKHPLRFRIVARVEDDLGKKKSVTIRHDQNGRRLEKAGRCLNTLENIRAELESGDFDYRDYDSKKMREQLEFTNFVDQIYLPFHFKRWKNKEITKSGYKNKVKSCNHLKNFFKKQPVNLINTNKVRGFRVNYDATENTINYTVNELKTILFEAHRLGHIKSVPRLDQVKSSKKRIEIMNYEQAKLICSKVKNEKYKDIISLALFYPVRPSEFRALRWNDIDFVNHTITFDEHFSEGELTTGRKSQGEGEKYSKLTLPLLSEAREIFQKYVSIENELDSFIFKGKYKDSISDRPIQRAWREAVQLSGLKKTPTFKLNMYEIKHALLSHLESNGVSISVLEKMSGVRAKTLMERYVYAKSENVNDAFNILEFKEAQ